ncbi:Amidohydrolase 3 [Aequoribacter fuscus]|uniref:Amidohydrolase 3 n=1 Tax=Aequoribacter fuscus TaxID=2518989 RepID=F3KZD0_9GAMM|nr:amidohydrolase family protein [Aequoribacter fuscus]EGG30617.1 Amidohydrolase 3 [Aequoribacter fuscus]QHJ87514.1 D-aminoacylase [Aequoribacter fuscus]
MSSTFIQGGTVVDGTGAPAYTANVRIEDGVIAAIGVDVSAQAGDEVIDAAGCYVAPGFIETHTHFDANMWWQPDLDPLPGYGVTTTILGNCGFTAAPVSDDEAVRLEMVNIFSFFEDIPVAPFLDHLPWDWRTWPEYKESMTSKVKVPANYAAFVGHLAIRLVVMGLEAWERAATPEEIQKMCAMLDEALAAGALGMSSNLLDHDGQDRPVPTMLATDEEWEALFDVLAKYPGATLQVIVDTFMRKTAAESVERIDRLIGDRRIRAQVAGMAPTLTFQKDIEEKVGPLRRRLAAEKRDIRAGFAHVPPTSVISIKKSLIFAQSNDYVWHEVVLAETEEEKLRILQDEDWRARARVSWDEKVWRHSPFANPQSLLLINSENGVGPVDISLEQYANDRGLHPSDAMADWLILNSVHSTVHMAPFPQDEEMVVELIKDPWSVPNISDAGAHGQMLCGGGENIRLLTYYCREKGWITVEEAVHAQTGKLADFFGLHDLGKLQVGKRADITVFNMDEIERRPMKKAFDVPDENGGTTWRFTRDPAPVRVTMVNGEVTFAGGVATGAAPGQMLAPSAA